MVYEKEELLSDKPDSKLESIVSQTETIKPTEEIPYSKKVAIIRDFSYGANHINDTPDVIDINT